MTISDLSHYENNMINRIGIRAFHIAMITYSSKKSLPVKTLGVCMGAYLLSVQAGRLVGLTSEAIRYAGPLRGVGMRWSGISTE